VSRPRSAERMQRLLAMVPWIAAQDGPTLEEVCERFGITRAQLLDDLGVVWLIGLPPYTPDALIDVVEEGDRVWIHFADVFDRPQRLTPDQGLALLTAGASLLALPGADPDGPLARGVEKLAAVLGVDARQVLEVDLGGGRPEILDTLRTAIRDRRRVHLDYYSYGRDARTERDVDPFRIESDEGALYLLGHCHRADGPRRFRLDRIHAATALDDHVDAPEAGTGSGVFEPDDDDPRVELELEPEARWVASYYPVEAVEELGGGRTRVRLAVSARPWFERLLVRLGSSARVIDAQGDLAGAGPRAARRILARYQGA
jgi:predicted DNA-binding transcriptional regulator YafY